MPTPVNPADRFRHAKILAMGGDPLLLGRPGTTVFADEQRAGTRRVAWYGVGGHTFLPCDPGVIDQLEQLASGDASSARSLSGHDVRAWAADVGAEVLGQSVMKVAGDAGLVAVEPAAPVHRLDWSRSADVQMMQRFVDVSSNDDLDEAEVAMDDLDDHALALLFPDGSIASYASSRPFDDDEHFGDIAVVTHANARRGGWGRSAVSALIELVLRPAGIEPLYRCDHIDNLGSHLLSEALGFETVAELVLIELPER